MAVGGKFLSVRTVSLIKTLFESFVVTSLFSAAKETLKKSLNILRNITCVVASRLLGGSNSQIFKGISARPICMC